MADYFYEDKTPQKAYDAALMRRLLSYLRPYRGLVLLAILLLAVAALLGLAGPWLVKIAIDQGITTGNHQRLIQVALLYFLMLALEFLTSLARTVLVQVLGQNFMRDLRLQVFSHLQTLSLRFFDRNPAGRLITRLTSDVEVINELFTSGLIAVFGDIFLLIGIMIFLLVMNPFLAGVTFSVLPLMALITIFFRTRLRNSFRAVRYRLARINAFLQERLAGMTTIQALGQETRSRDRFGHLNRQHMESQLATVFHFALFWPLVELVASVSVAMILWFGGLRILVAPEHGLTLGILAAFIQYARRFFQPLSDLSEKFNIMQAAMASSERIFALLDAEPEITAPHHPEKLRTCRGEIAFENVSFAYEPEKPVLKEMSFRARSGQKVALVGMTGGGKSTIINLLLRYYDPQGGRILLDGIDLRRMDPDALRRHFALVQQDIVIFSGTVAENISLGDPAIGEEQVLAACSHVGADDLIARLPNGAATPLRPGGEGLSTGQKQLIAFARALAHDPPVLILDEATSAVDTETEQVILKATERLMRDRTSIVVAHRLATVLSADKILVVQHGHLVESGSHEDLLAEGGVYSRLYRLQFQTEDSQR